MYIIYNYNTKINIFLIVLYNFNFNYSVCNKLNLSQGELELSLCLLAKTFPRITAFGTFSLRAVSFMASDVSHLTNI